MNFKITPVTCLLLFIIAVIPMVNSQQFYHFNGSTFTENDSVQYIYILYADPCCSACVKSLIAYCMDIRLQYPQVQIVLAVKTENTDYACKRWAMESTYEYGSSIPIVFDHMINKRESICLRKKIKTFPCVWLASPKNKRYDYIPYDKIFSNGNLNTGFTAAMDNFLH